MGHIFNGAFEYVNVPYEDMPNLMFNSGGIWSEFIEKLISELFCSKRLSSVYTAVNFYFGLPCQRSNYQFLAKYCRYFLDTCTLS